MHKGFSISRAVAVDAICVISGFLAGISAINLLPGSLDPTAAARSVLHALQTPIAAPHTIVNRDRKGDRLDLVPFSERFSAIQAGSAERATAVPHRDMSGRVLFWIDPASSTMIVPKGVVLAESTRRESVEPQPAVKPVPDSNGPPASSKVIGCEPLASRLVDPSLAQLARRCMAQLASPTVE
jgi:hypothetical protein